jgi:predicted SnoaL-like aldol condensation-catalyzing enzyme
MSDSLRQVAERWFEEVWNLGRRETIDELLDPDCVIHDAGQDIVGPAGFKLFYDNIQTVLSTIHVDSQQVMSQGDYVLVRWVSTGKHKPDGRDVQITGMSLMRFRNGRAVEAWQNWDLHGLMEQIKAVPERTLSQAAG